MDSKELYLQSFKNIQTSKVTKFNSTKMCYSSSMGGQGSVSELDKEISQKKRSDFFTQYKKLGGQKQIAQTKLSDKGKGRLMVICKDKSNAPSRAGSFFNMKSGSSHKFPSANSPLPCGSPVPGKSRGNSSTNLLSPIAPKLSDILDDGTNERMFITNLVDTVDEVSLTAVHRTHTHTNSNTNIPTLDLRKTNEVLSPIMSPIPKRKPKNCNQLHNNANNSNNPNNSNNTVPRYAHAEVSILSPRSHYMDACLRSRINPRPALISKLTQDKIHLQHQVSHIDIF